MPSPRSVVLFHIAQRTDWSTFLAPSLVVEVEKAMSRGLAGWLSFLDDEAPLQTRMAVRRVLGELSMDLLEASEGAWNRPSALAAQPFTTLGPCQRTVEALSEACRAATASQPDHSETASR